jgi:hypothetical protein
VLTLPRQKIGVEGTLQHESSTTAGYNQPTIDEYLRKRLMPVEGAIPHLPGIEMYGNSIPAGTVGGDLFEYINVQQRYDIDARIQRAVNCRRSFLNRYEQMSLRVTRLTIMSGGYNPDQDSDPKRKPSTGRRGVRNRCGWQKTCTNFTPQQACCW